MGFFDVLGAVFNAVAPAVEKNYNDFKEKASKAAIETDEKISRYESRSDLTAEQREKVAKAREHNDRVKKTLGL